MPDRALPSGDPDFPDLLAELEWRGLVHVSTDREALRALLAGRPITFYGGFDPTAPSLHLGSLVLILTMRRLQLAGHRPLGLVGGSTGLIGDPKPDAERTLNPPEVVAGWVESIGGQVARFFDADGPNAFGLVDNLEWTAPLGVLEFLRDVGKHFRVGAMLRKDAVSARMESSEGISFTEFSYQILQGLDFRELRRRESCVLQIGGSDQWGNLVSGVDLIRRSDRVEAHALATPLIVDSSGRKFGKSEGNALWLDARLTSPWALHQYLVNTDDADVVARLKVFTFLSRSRIEELGSRTVEEPRRREAQRVLAREVVTLVHGAGVASDVEAAAAALFGSGPLADVPGPVLEQALADAPHARLEGGTPLDRALVAAGLVTSLAEARRAIAQGGVQVNDSRADDPAAPVTALPGSDLAVLRRGKRALAGVRLG